jgi:hypothetical protein
LLPREHTQSTYATGTLLKTRESKEQAFYSICKATNSSSHKATNTTLNSTYSLAFLPSQNEMLPYTMGTLISTSLSFLFKIYTKKGKKKKKKKKTHQL